MNRNGLGVAMCVICFTAGGAAGYGAESATTYSLSVFTEARALIRENKKMEAASKLDKIAAQNPGDTEPAKSYRLDALYLAGMCFMDLGNWTEAKARLEKVVAAADHDLPLIDRFPSGFARTIIAYGGLCEIAAKEGNNKRASQYAQKAQKKLAERLSIVEKRIKMKQATRDDLLLQSWILPKKTFIDWKVANPDKSEMEYHKSRSGTAGPSTSPKDTSTTGACGCGCGGSSATLAAAATAAGTADAAVRAGEKTSCGGCCDTATTASGNVEAKK